MSQVSDSIQKIIDTGTIASRWANGTDTETIETAGGPLKTLAGINKGMIALVLASLSATSNTTMSATRGSKTLLVQPGKSFQQGQYVTIASADIVLGGVVSSYGVNTLVVDVDYTKGVGSASSWQVSLSGLPGADGSGAQLITNFPWEA
jgi:hypothetical protein